MNLGIASMMAVILLMMFKDAYSKPRSSCHVADEIRLFNSDEYWWWSAQSERPKVTHKPSNIFSKSSKEWLVFFSQHRGTKLSVIEIAHKLSDGKCRFLVKKLNGQGIGFSLKKKCQAGVTGEKGFFRVSYESGTERIQITHRARKITPRQKKYLGLDNENHLVLSSLRSRNMAWWNINFNKSKRC